MYQPAFMPPCVRIIWSGRAEWKWAPPRQLLPAPQGASALPPAALTIWTLATGPSSYLTSYWTLRLARYTFYKNVLFTLCFMGASVDVDSVIHIRFCRTQVNNSDKGCLQLASNGEAMCFDHQHKGGSGQCPHQNCQRGSCHERDMSVLLTGQGNACISIPPADCHNHCLMTCTAARVSTTVVLSYPKP